MEDRPIRIYSCPYGQEVLNMNGKQSSFRNSSYSLEVLCWPHACGTLPHAFLTDLRKDLFAPASLTTSPSRVGLEAWCEAEPSTDRLSSLPRSSVRSWDWICSWDKVLFSSWVILIHIRVHCCVRTKHRSSRYYNYFVVVNRRYTSTTKSEHVTTTLLWPVVQLVSRTVCWKFNQRDTSEDAVELRQNAVIGLFRKNTMFYTYTPRFPWGICGRNACLSWHRRERRRMDIWTMKKGNANLKKAFLSHLLV